MNERKYRDASKLARSLAARTMSDERARREEEENKEASQSDGRQGICSAEFRSG